MKSFAFQHDQVVRIVAALTADELARRFGRYTETLTLSRWGADTRLGRGGVEANRDQQVACANRAAQFFDLEEDTLTPEPGDTFGAWAERLLVPVSRSLTHFRFHPATPAGFVNTRHGADDIYADAASVASLLHGRKRCVCLVGPHSLLGLVASVIAPNLQGMEVIDGRCLGPDDIAETVRFGDIVIANPTLWRYLSDTLPGLANNVMGLSFGERFGTDLAGRLRAKGLGAMRELYGSTETGVVGWRDGPPGHFTLFDHWSREGDCIVRERPNGQRCTMLPMDDLVWHGKASFAIGGRRDGAIQIGAMNVFPHAIAATIEQHPDVLACDVRVSQRSGALDRLIADIVLYADRLPDQKMAWSIDEWCRERLRPTERPRIYHFTVSEGT